jgi:hypothetical protein
MNPKTIQDIYPQHVNWDEEHGFTSCNTMLFGDNHTTSNFQVRETQARGLTTASVAFLLGLNINP